MKKVVATVFEHHVMNVSVGACHTLHGQTLMASTSGKVSETFEGNATVGSMKREYVHLVDKFSWPPHSQS